MASRRAPSQISQQIERAITNNELSDRVLIPNYWFEEDGYGAAVAGIMKSVELGLKSGSLGTGLEEHILLNIRNTLTRLDPAIRIKD